MKKIKYYTFSKYGEKIGVYDTYEDVYNALPDLKDHYTQSPSYQLQVSLFGGKVEKKTGHIVRIEEEMSQEIAGVIKEGKRVRWPKRDVLIPSIIVVVIIAAVTGLLLFGEDIAGKRLIDILSDAFQSMK